MAASLEERARRPDQIQVNATLLDVLAPLSGERLLEVGSGSGVLCRLMAPYIAPSGRVTGLDISPAFIAQACRYAAEQGMAGSIAFAVGQAETLPYADARFDAAYAARLMLHVNRPDVVLREMMRVVRPGGRIVLMDWIGKPSQLIVPIGN